MTSISNDLNFLIDKKDIKRKIEEIEKNRIDNLEKTLNPEEDIAILFKNIFLKSNINKMKYPKVSK